jgi:trans-aconitate methyltransferase
MTITYPRLFLLIVSAVILGGLIQWRFISGMVQPAPIEVPTAVLAKAGDAPPDLEALNADVTRLKGVVPSASVAMADVGFHFGNLWFAGQRQNWPLATYYFNESRNHIRWLVRITPMPKGPTGELVDLQGIFDGIDTSVLKDLKDTIDKKDSARFAAAYRQTLEACYSCHKAVGRAYLRPMIPTAPQLTIINLDPAATWPQ